MKQSLLLLFVLAAFTQSLTAQTTDTTVVDIIVNSPDHDTLETAVITAGLDDDLSADGPFTVFAPNDSAFAALPAGSVEALLADSAGLANILLYHVVSGTFTSDLLTDSMMLTTLQGDSIMVTISGDSVMVDGVMIVAPDLVASNGVVHSINGILMPDTSTTSIRRVEPAFGREVSIAPNPARDYFNVGLPASIVKNATLTLRDLTGRTVTTVRATSENVPLQVGNLPVGTYLLEVRSGAEAIQRKVVVQR